MGNVNTSQHIFGNFDDVILKKISSMEILTHSIENIRVKRLKW